MQFPHQERGRGKITHLLLLIVLIGAIVIGVGFRLYPLDRKLYWHDEVYTSLRAAGYTGLEMGQQIFSNQNVQPNELLKFQRIKPGSDFGDTIASLAKEDPQHPPLYYLMSRAWMQVFGSDIAMMRLLAVLISLLSLPLIYSLALELFSSRPIALTSVALLALSPFDVLFAQIARQYSLLTVTTIASSLCLLRAMRLKRVSSWSVYAATNALGLYTHPFFSFTIIGHGIYLLLLQLPLSHRLRVKSEVGRSQVELLRSQNFFYRYLLASIGSLVLYLPWILVLMGNYQRALSSTNWASGATDWFFNFKLWMLSFTALFLDLDVGFDNAWTYVIRLPILLTILAGIWAVCRQTQRQTWLFVVTSIFVPFLMLVLPDLLLGGRRSSVSRYLISCYPGVQLAVAYLIGSNLERSPLNNVWNNIQTKIETYGKTYSQFFWRLVLVSLFACSIASCTVSAMAETWWSNIPSYFNAETARLVNQRAKPLLIVDEGDDGTMLGDLISLSYLLSDRVSLELLSKTGIPNLSPSYSDWLAFRPSARLRAHFRAQGKELEVISGAANLWKVPQKPVS
ncbi:glycosyltransferase family 39 protein [Pseudanabaena sp. PCC 6802]|uniref:glycosyltransferase family 39 protein n=1 Tax=Pseudanabaena sp. PCC 6802 TaxID=118173 RepID=UPI000349A906|nr:glycosyltransferase family 39 protein [Pseudanabaena sp. PCC 6802]